MPLLKSILFSTAMGVRFCKLVLGVGMSSLLLLLSHCNGKCAEHPDYKLTVPVRLQPLKDTFHIGDTIQLYIKFNKKQMPAANTDESVDITQFPIRPRFTIINISDSAQYDLGWNSFKARTTINAYFERNSESVFLGINEFNYNANLEVEDTISIICKEKGAFILTGFLSRCYSTTTPGVSCPRKGWECTLGWANMNIEFDPNNYISLAQSEYRKWILRQDSSGYDIRFAFLVN